MGRLIEEHGLKQAAEWLFVCKTLWTKFAQTFCLKCQRTLSTAALLEMLKTRET
jgi:hypothetical protein